MVERNGVDEEYRVSTNLHQKQLDDYLEKMREAFEIKYYYAFDMNLDKKEKKECNIELESNEKVIRFVGVKNNKYKKDKIVKIGMVVRVKKPTRNFKRKYKILS